MAKDIISDIIDKSDIKLGAFDRLISDIKSEVKSNAGEFVLVTG